MDYGEQQFKRLQYLDYLLPWALLGNMSAYELHFKLIIVYFFLATKIN